jgi:hypothetical protein
MDLLYFPNKPVLFSQQSVQDNTAKVHLWKSFFRTASHRNSLSSPYCLRNGISNQVFKKKKQQENTVVYLHQLFLK